MRAIPADCARSTPTSLPVSSTLQDARQRATGGGRARAAITATASPIRCNSRASRANDGMAAVRGSKLETLGRFAGPGGKNAARAQGVVRIITERHHREAQLKHLSHHDPLTGDLNRATLTAALDEAEFDADSVSATRSASCVVGIDDLGAPQRRLRLRCRRRGASRRYRPRTRARACAATICSAACRATSSASSCDNCSLDDMNVAADRLLGGRARRWWRRRARARSSITVSIGGILVPRHAQTTNEVISRALEALDKAPPPPRHLPVLASVAGARGAAPRQYPRHRRDRSRR